MAAGGGQIVHQFNHTFAAPRYRLDEKEARKAVPGRTPRKKQKLDYQTYRMGLRKIARSSDERTIANDVLLYLCAVWNSLTVDWLIRLRVSANVNFFYVSQLPSLCLTEKVPAFRPLVERAARLVRTGAESDDPGQEVCGAKATPRPHSVTDPAARQQLRAAPSPTPSWPASTA